MCSQFDAEGLSFVSGQVLPMLASAFLGGSLSAGIAVAGSLDTFEILLAILPLIAFSVGLGILGALLLYHWNQQ